MLLYYNNELVNYKRQQTPLEQRVYSEITEIKNEYFGENKLGKVVLLYPNGEIRERDKGWTQAKQFAIPLKGKDGMWRCTGSVRNPNNNRVNQGYVDHHKFVTYETVLTEKDIEFIWFLKHESSVLGKYVFFEDLEGDAKEEVEAMASDAEVRFMITSPKSPISKNETLLREVASVMGVPNTDKIGINQLKKELYETLVDGHEYGDKYINYDTFDKLVNGDKVRKAAHVARRAISNNIVGYSKSAWWLMNGRNYEERLVNVSPTDGASRDQVFIQAVVDNATIRSRVFMVMGEQENITLKDLREQDRSSLQRTLRELTGEFSSNDKKEEIIEKLCKQYDIRYEPLTR